MWPRRLEMSPDTVPKYSSGVVTERSGVAEGVAADVTLRAETDLEVSVLDGETQIGTELTFRVWDDLLDAPDDQVFVIK